MRVMIVSETQSYLILSLKTKFEEASINVDLTKPDTTQVSRLKDQPDAIFFYVDEALMENQAAVIYVRDKALDQDIPIFISGNSDVVEKLKDIIPRDLLKKVFPRPMNVVDVVRDIKNYLLSEETNSKKLVLVVDDSGAMLRNVKGWLENKYQVALANSGTMAIKYLGTNRPDLILLDYEMPVIDGRQVLEMIRSESELADIPVVFLTSKDDKESVMKVMSLKPAGYLLKTMAPAEIVKFVDDFFLRRRVL